MRRLKNCDKTEPRELAGEPKVSSGWVFSFCTKERLQGLKTQKSCSEEEGGTLEGMTNCEERAPVGRTALFYTLKIKHFIKMCRTVWRDFLLTTDDEHRFSSLLVKLFAEPK